MADSAKVAAENKINGVNQKISNTINETIRKGIEDIKERIYNSLEPIFPWIFILCFLLLFAALKAVIPFSNAVIVQIPLVFLSYISIFFIYSSIGLIYFAIIGTLWILVPVLAVCFISYKFRERLIPKIQEINDKITGKRKSRG